jgi:hypothetical protein
LSLGRKYERYFRLFACVSRITDKLKFAQHQKNDQLKNIK